MSLKLLAYRFSMTKLGGAIARGLSFGVSIPYIKKSPKKPNKKPFLISLTIDTESGYVAVNQRRVWQKEAPDAYLGYYAGIKNLRELFKRHGVEATFFLSTHCFSAQGEDYKRIMAELFGLLRDGHEIGLHLHPDSDKALQKELGQSFPATSCFFHDEKQLLEFIDTSRKIIGTHLGKENTNLIGKNGEKITSIRWGNWALNTEGAKAINEAGLLVDSSATPGIKGHLDDGRKYDWSKAKEHYPWLLSTTDYQSTREGNNWKKAPIKTQKGKKQTLEIPIATFSFFGKIMRADPQYSALLSNAFLEYYHQTDRSERPFPFVVTTHSCEATMQDGKKTQVLSDIEKFILFVKQFSGVKFVTVENARKMYSR